MRRANGLNTNPPALLGVSLCCVRHPGSIEQVGSEIQKASRRSRPFPSAPDRNKLIGLISLFATRGSARWVLRCGRTR